MSRVRTRGACRDFAGSNATPIGSTNPKTTLGVPVVPESVGGSIWYRTSATGTERIELREQDLAAHWVNVAADQPEIDGRATVLRDARGRAVLVDVGPEVNVPG